MSGSSDQHDERVPDGELTLYAFGELPADRVDDVERLLRQDPDARAAAAGMRRLARWASEDVCEPTDALLAATRAAIQVALVRKTRRRRIGIVAALGSVAAAAVVVLVVARVSSQTPPVGTVAEAPQPAGSQPAVVGLTDADRQAIRQTIARIRRERIWDDPLDYRMLRLRRKIDRLAGELLVAPRATQPAGSTRRPAPTQEAHHV